MTDHCYIAVKGSLHSTDSSVFGLTTEEIIALSKRFSDSCKEVINGVLIKGSPIQVINALGEIGYRVICSSGETEIVWTLRREVLVPDKPLLDDERCMGRVPTKMLPLGNVAMLPRNNVISENGTACKPTHSSSVRRIFDQSGGLSQQKGEKKKSVHRLGTKPEDLAEYGNKDGSVINIRNPESLDEIPIDKKIIINSNLSSRENPLSSRLSDFVSIYSETIGRSLPPTVPERKSFMKCQSRNSTSKSARGSHGQFCNNLGTKPEDLAQFGNKDGSVIDIRNPESLDEIPLNQKIIINSNLSSEGNPFAFVSAYSETIGQSLPPTVPEKKADVKFQSRANSPAKCTRGSPGQFCNILGRNAETVLAEYNNESNIANLDSSKRQCHILPGNVNVCSPSMPRNMNDNVRNASTFQSESSRKKDNQPMNNPRNLMPASSTPQKTVEKLGSKPEDLAQYGSKRDPKINVLNYEAFEELNPEEIEDRRIILNTNLSSEGNPMSGRNLQSHPPKSGH